MVSQFSSIFELIKAFPDEQSCINHLELLRWSGNIISPFDSTSKVYKCAGNKYKCKNTGKYFNVKVGTIFEDTKIPLLKWFMALYVFSSHKKGISSHQLARDISVTQKSAWFMLQRLRYGFEHPKFKQFIGGTVEVDETFIGGDEYNKHADKKTEGNQGRSNKTKAVVFGMKQREGNVVAKVVPDTKGATLKPIIKESVAYGSNLISDEWVAYNGLNKQYNHERVNHGAKQFVNGMAHTNGIENFWSHLKRGIDGIYHWVSKEHIQRYVNEFALRYNTRGILTSERFNLILSNAATKRLTYKELTTR